MPLREFLISNFGLFGRYSRHDVPIENVLDGNGEFSAKFRTGGEITEPRYQSWRVRRASALVLLMDPVAREVGAVFREVFGFCASGGPPGQSAGSWPALICLGWEGGSFPGTLVSILRSKNAFRSRSD